MEVDGMEPWITIFLDVTGDELHFHDSFESFYFFLPRADHFLAPADGADHLEYHVPAGLARELCHRHAAWAKYRAVQTRARARADARSKSNCNDDVRHLRAFGLWVTNSPFHQGRRR